jgi:hypothetical protein
MMLAVAISAIVMVVCMGTVIIMYLRTKQVLHRVTNVQRQQILSTIDDLAKTSNEFGQVTTELKEITVGLQQSLERIRTGGEND